MSSMPSEELRSSYRSQLSVSTGPGTTGTERSSVATKNSSVTSVYGAADDSFSLDDIMGMYEKGFYDDSAPEDNEMPGSRPPTAKSELSRRRTAMLDAMTDLLPTPESPTTPSTPGSVQRHSATTSNDLDTHEFSHDIEAQAEAQGEAQGEVEAEVEAEAKAPADIETDDDDDDFKPSPPTREPTGLTIAEDNDERDRYGFRKSNQYVTREQYDEWNQGYKEYLDRRRKKWVVFLREHGLMTDQPNRFPPRSNKTKRFVRKGIPPDWRGSAWFYYAGGPAVVAKHAGTYESLLKQKAKDVDIEAIERDLHRTFPDNVKFRSAQMPSMTGKQSTKRESEMRTDEKPMILALRRVLRAFAIYNPKIGYCQSLNFLAGLLLLFVETEEHAFWLLNIITRVYLPGTHETSLEGANVDLGVLMSSLRESMPQVWGKIGGELDGTDVVWPKTWKHRHMKSETTRLPPITLCMTAWFMSCYIGTLPIESTLRVWDVFFYEGSKTLFRIALAIFKIGENEIKAVGDPMEIFQVVQTIPRRLVDANGLIEACFRRRNGFGHLSQDTVEQKRQERRTQVKAEREKLAANMDGPGADMGIRKKGTLFGRH
ncbi:RabGAP/TBC [Hypoxylon fragiforme]|uniref:RabGAP/TBC n=1 Tax=Hypoxylon fragiforme TaxID=63214 RepID=UPI0020C68727|nr:RabGAP/TBC [Hypoxylon fragiforme]KAI2609357.1 RabGAP/TBC [Hypoxylon fragiforme]